MVEDQSRNRPANETEVVITPKMIAAGVSVLHAEAGDDLGQISAEGELVASMFRAMIAASLAEYD